MPGEGTDNAGSPPRPFDPPVNEDPKWFQTSARLLANGDFMRWSVEAQGRRILIQIGRPMPADQEKVEWFWEIITEPAELAEIGVDQAYTLMMANKHTEGVLAQVQDRHLSAEAELARVSASLNKDGKGG